jgi:hypothetical protein
MSDGSINTGGSTPIQPGAVPGVTPYFPVEGEGGYNDAGSAMDASSISRTQIDARKVLIALASHPELLPAGMLGPNGMLDLDLFSTDFRALLVGTNVAGISDISAIYNVNFDTSPIINNILENMAKTNEETAKILKEADKAEAQQKELRDEFETTSAALLANQSINFMAFMALFSAGADGAPYSDFASAFGSYVVSTLQSAEFNSILTSQAKQKVELMFPDLDQKAKDELAEKWVEMTKASIAYTALGVVLQESDFSGGEIDTLIEKAGSPAKELLEQVTQSVNTLSTWMTQDEIKAFFSDVKSKNREYIEDQGQDPVVMIHSFINYLGSGGGVDISNTRA